jgi:hypothetical protein
MGVSGAQGGQSATRRSPNEGNLMENLTPTQRLAAIKLGRSLADYVDEKRTAHPRWSWEMIADQLAEDTDGDIVVSREALRQWYGQAAA